MELEIKIPPVGESITEVTIGNWVKKDGDFVKQEELLVEIESDKTTFELTAEQSGTLKILVKEGETVNIGTKIASIDTAASAPASNGAAPKTEAKVEAKTEVAMESNKSDSYAKGFPSPSAAKILAEKDIDPASVNGTGKDGRITKNDAQTAEKTAPISSNSTPTPSAPEVSTPKPVLGERNVRREKMTTLRKTIAKRLVEVKNQTAMLTTFNEIDMSAVMEMRKKYKDTFKEKHNIGLGFMSLFTKACVEALKEFPAVNGQIDGTDIIYHDYCDIGIAVSTPKGLVVPNIRNAETMSLADIEKEISNLAVKARDGKLSMEEMTGGTFSITNGGVFGSLMSTPILNAPQSAILGMHNIVERPIAVNGQVVIRPMMYVALSYDHRIVDGKESVSFLVRVKQMIEDPYRMLLEV
jgi:2-oxoglutarate dehydrogenase E2 component (dihydrolipoamide succinyltransferase)